MQVLRALSTLSVEALFQDHLFGERRETRLLGWTTDEPQDAGGSMSGETREEKLFDLFTAYAMQISSEDPTSIRMVNVIKLLHDCNIIHETVATSDKPHDSLNQQQQAMLESNKDDTLSTRLTIRDIEIITAKLLHTSTTCTKLSYEDFLKLLYDLALHAHPQLPPGHAFKQLVDDCVRNQPKSKTRVRSHVDDAYKTAEKVFAFFEPSLVEIFKFYADATHKTNCKHRNKIKAQSATAPKPASKKRPVVTTNMSSLYLNYRESFAFARKFGLVSHGGVTVAEFAVSYIDSVEKVKNTTRQLTYLGFCHLLLRLAMKMYTNTPISISMKLKALFQFMWLNSLDVKPSESSKLCGHRDQGSATLHVEGTTTFRALFLKQWKKDNFIDYAAQVKANGPTIPQRNVAIKQALLEPMAFTYSP